MLSTVLLRSILHNEAMTRGLGDPEARLLVEWVIDQAEGLAARLTCPERLTAAVQGLCRRARSLSRFVGLWCYAGSHGAACQLAATERFAWPLPTTNLDPCELMDQILTHEGERLAAG
jgi:hypothetical protein